MVASHYIPLSCMLTGDLIKDPSKYKPFSVLSPMTFKLIQFNNFKKKENTHIKHFYIIFDGFFNCFTCIIIFNHHLHTIANTHCNERGKLRQWGPLAEDFYLNARNYMNAHEANRDKAVRRGTALPRAR